MNRVMRMRVVRDVCSCRACHSRSRGTRRSSVSAAGFARGRAAGSAQRGRPGKGEPRRSRERTPSALGDNWLLDDTDDGWAGIALHRRRVHARHDLAQRALRRMHLSARCIGPRLRMRALRTGAFALPRAFANVAVAGTANCSTAQTMAQQRKPNARTHVEQARWNGREEQTRRARGVTRARDVRCRMAHPPFPISNPSARCP